MYYPKNLEFTEVEEVYFDSCTDIEDAEDTLDLVLEVLDARSDLTDKQLLIWTEIKVELRADLDVAATPITTELTFEELVIVRKKIEHRKKYRNQIEGYPIKYAYETNNKVHIQVAGMDIEGVEMFYDSEMNDRHYVVIDSTILYLDTLDQI